MKSIFKFLFCVLILLTGFTNTHAQSDDTKYKAYFKIDSTSAGEEAVLNRIYCKKIDGGYFSSKNAYVNLTKGLYRVDYEYSIKNNETKVTFSAMRDIKSDTTITLKPLKYAITVISTLPGTLWKDANFDDESMVELMREYDNNHALYLDSRVNPDSPLDKYLSDLRTNEKSDLTTKSMDKWSSAVVNQVTHKTVCFFTELPSPLVFYTSSLSDEQKAANSLYLFNAQKDANDNWEFRAITTEKQDDEYIELTSDGNFLKVSVKHLGEYTLVHSSGYTVRYYNTEGKLLDISCGVEKASDKKIDGMMVDKWTTADGKIWDFDTPLDGDLCLYTEMGNKVYFNLLPTSDNKEAKLAEVTLINILKNDTISSTDVDSCLFLPNGLYSIDYKFLHDQKEKHIQMLVKEIKSDTVFALQPFMGFNLSSRFTSSSPLYDMKYLDWASLYEMIQKYPDYSNYSFHLNSVKSDTTSSSHKYLISNLESLRSTENSHLIENDYKDWNFSGGPKNGLLTPINELPAPLIIYIPLAEEHKAANSLYMFNAHEDEGNLELRCITTEKQDDEYIELTADGNFLKVSVKHLSTFTLTHSSGYTVNYYVDNKKVSSSYGVVRAIDKPTDSYGSNYSAWYTADNKMFDFNTVLTGDLNLYANVKTTGGGEVIKPVYYSISGTVSDVMGNPVADAVVTLKQSKTVINRDTTDAAGYYSIGKLDNTKYDLSVSAGSNYGTYACDGILMGSNPIYDIVLSLTSTDINDASLAAVQVIGQQGALRILNATPGKLYQIVSVSGAVTKGFITGTDQTIPLSSGFYVVLLNGKSMKVIVR